MMSLIVYAKGSVFKYPGLYEKWLYEIDSHSNVLKISSIDRSDQYEEKHCATFRNWDYFLLEEETEI